MANVNNYGLTGVNRNLQLGKKGPKLVGDADSYAVTFTEVDGTTLATAGGANAQSSTDFITKAQLDNVSVIAIYTAELAPGTGTEVTLGNVTSGVKTIEASVEVFTGFDTEASVEIGTSSDNDLLMSDTHNDLTDVDTFVANQYHTFGSETELKVFFNANSATTGNARVVVTITDGTLLVNGDDAYLPITGGTVTGNTTFNSVVTATAYKDSVFTITDGASVDIDPDNGGIQVWTLGANRSPTADNFDAGAKVMLMINDGSSYSITWPSVNWVGGVAPTLATSGYSIIELWKVGTQLYGSYAGGVA